MDATFQQNVQLITIVFTQSSSRFLADGTWEFVNVSISRVLIEYNCCPEAYAEIFHYVMFKRRPEFYISYIIVPCTLISFLALLVFYLPAECGEKLTLSTTNLLGLVVFQQLVSATMPPSAEASPILGMCLMKLRFCRLEILFSWTSKNS